MKKFFWFVLNILTLGIPAIVAHFLAKRKTSEQKAVGEVVRHYAKHLTAIPTPAPATSEKSRVRSRKSHNAGPKPAGTRTMFVMVRYHGRKVAAKLVRWIGRGNRLEAALPNGTLLRPRRKNIRLFSVMTETA